MLAELKAAIINTSCDYNSISNAVFVLATEGDIVLIGPGDCVISNTMFISRGISFTIMGSGNSTTLRSVSGQNETIWVQTSSTNPFNIHDFNFIHAANSGANFAIGAGVSSLDMSGPIHIWNISMTNIVGRGIGGGAGKTHNTYGLVDHCNLRAATSGWLQSFQGDGSDYGAWTNSPILGTTNTLVFEDNSLYTDSAKGQGNGFIDNYRGSRFVFRHNYCDGYAPVGGHGYDSQATSFQSFEIYNNIFTNFNFSSAPSTMINIRGGTGVVISNDFFGTNLATLNITDLINYRCYPDSFPNIHDVTGYLNKGVPGRLYTINFTHVNQAHGEGFPQAAYSGFAGYDPFPTGQPTNGQFIVLGQTAYFFVTNLSSATIAMRNANGRGGGPLLIGATTAETITNWMNAINLGPGANVTRTNWALGPTDIPLGFEFLATGCDTTNLYLRNALDSTNAFGYPPNQQPGVLTSFSLSTTGFVQHATVWPVIINNNTVNGVIRDLHAGSAIYPGNPNTNTLFEGRDWTNSTPASQGYTFLAYPHPLQAQEGTNLPPALTGIFNLNTIRVGGIVKLQ